jgi:hypothetical protein
MLNNLKARHHLSSFNIAMESIDFQRDSFGSQIEAILFEIEKFIRDSTYDSMHLRTVLQDHEMVHMLSDLFMKRLGLNVVIAIKPGEMGSMSYYVVNSNHVLNKPYRRGVVDAELQDRILKLVKERKGRIDLQNAHVDGVFSEFKNFLEIDLVGLFLNADFTIPEVTAIILHELGHAFNYYALADRLETTNQILASLSKEIRGGNNTEKRHLLFKDLTKQFGIKDSSFDDLLSETNNTIIGVRLFDMYIKCVKSQLPNAKYDETSSEALADNFASRFGYGRQLVLALDKGTQKFPEKNTFVATCTTFYQFITDVALPGLMIIGSFIGGIGIFGVLVAVFYSVLLVMSGEQHQDYTYDNLKMRYQRIRQQYIEMLKTSQLKKEEMREVIDNIHFIDSVIKGTQIYRDLFNRLSNFIFPSSRGTVQSVELQYLLEELSTNGLFLRSAELSVLS